VKKLALVSAVGLLMAACSGGHHTATLRRSTVSTSTSTTSNTASSLATTTSTAAPLATSTTAHPVTPTTRKPAVAPKSVGSQPVAAGPTIAGCSLFPADNAWRRDVSSDPVSPESDAWVASIGAASHVHPDFGSDPTYGIPYVVVPASQPKVPITFTAYGDQSDPGPYPVPHDAPVESGSDHHVLVASGDCHLYEMFDAAADDHGGWDAGSGAVFDLGSDKLRPDTWTSADAAGLPILPGLVRYDEIQSGHIDHALRFTASRTQRGFIHPATHQAGSTTDAGAPPMGARFRLKASFDISGFHGEARVVLECLRRYGMFLADNGSNWFISGSTDTRWNDDDLDQLKSVPGSAFEAVSSGPVLH
jgi:hypothetical protein